MPTDRKDKSFRGGVQGEEMSIKIWKMAIGLIKRIYKEQQESSDGSSKNKDDDYPGEIGEQPWVFLKTLKELGKAETLR